MWPASPLAHAGLSTDSMSTRLTHRARGRSPEGRLPLAARPQAGGGPAQAAPGQARLASRDEPRLALRQALWGRPTPRLPPSAPPPRASAGHPSSARRRLSCDTWLFPLELEGRAELAQQVLLPLVFLLGGISNTLLQSKKAAWRRWPCGLRTCVRPHAGLGSHWEAPLRTNPRAGTIRRCKPSGGLRSCESPGQAPTAGLRPRGVPKATQPQGTRDPGPASPQSLRLSSLSVLVLAVTCCSRGTRLVLHALVRVISQCDQRCWDRTKFRSRGSEALPCPLSFSLGGREAGSQP